MFKAFVRASCLCIVMAPSTAFTAPDRTPQAPTNVNAVGEISRPPQVPSREIDLPEAQSSTRLRRDFKTSLDVVIDLINDFALESLPNFAPSPAFGSLDTTVIDHTLGAMLNLFTSPQSAHLDTGLDIELDPDFELEFDPDLKGAREYSVPTVPAEDTDVGYLWRSLDVSQRLSQSPTLKLRSLKHLLREVPDTPPIRVRIDELEVPVPIDFSQRWTVLKRYTRDREGVMVIGDSLSATDHYLRCFQERMPKTQQRVKRKTNLIRRWRSQGALSVLARDSYATQPGATSWRLTRPPALKRHVSYGQRRAELTNAPHMLHIPLLREIYESSARFAVVLLGTNDLRYHRGLERFSVRYLQIVETLLDMGVLPILYTLPPQLNAQRRREGKVSIFNRMIRTIAATERLPLVDFNRALLRLKNYGLRTDGIHLNAYQGGCNLKPRGLRFGQNLRNHLTLEALLTLDELINVVHSKSPRCGAPTHLDLFRSLNVEQRASKIRAPPHLNVISSVVSHTSPLLIERGACVRQLHKRAHNARRWVSLRPRRPTAVGPPLKAYGTWRGTRHTIKLHRDSKLDLLVLSSLDGRPDLSRRQLFIQIANGRCVKISKMHQEIRLPKGEHYLWHYARLDSPPMPTPSEASSDDLKSRVVFSWE